MSEEVRFLTMSELCFKLRISDNCARGLLEEKKLAGMRLRNGEWRIVDPGPRFDKYLQELPEHLAHVPLLSSHEVAAVMGRHPVAIRLLVKQGKLKATKVGKRRFNMFTVAEVRRFMIERQQLTAPQFHPVKIARLIQWAKQFLEQQNAGSVSAPTLDEIDEMVTQILRLPEPNRSKSLQALFLKLDKTDQIVRSVQNQNP